jgi:Cu2+-containing amine oxidase
MQERRLLSDREEAQALRLARSQPESAQELQQLIERVRAAAVEVVLNDPRVQQRLADTRYGVVGADLREDKPEGEATPSLRLAEVGLYDYDHDMLVVAVTDLRAGTVVDLEERAGVQPPLSTEELAEAQRIVLQDPQFQSATEHPHLQAVTFPARAAFSQGHQRYGHRVATVTLWTGEEPPSKVAEAAVDLSQRELVSVAEADLLDAFGQP